MHIHIHIYIYINIYIYLHIYIYIYGVRKETTRATRMSWSTSSPGSVAHPFTTIASPVPARTQTRKFIRVHNVSFTVLSRFPCVKI